MNDLDEILLPMDYSPVGTEDTTERFRVTKGVKNMFKNTAPARTRNQFFKDAMYRMVSNPRARALGTVGLMGYDIYNAGEDAQTPLGEIIDYYRNMPSDELQALYNRKMSID